MNFIIEIHDLKYLRFDVKLQWKSAFIQILTKVTIAARSLPSFNESFKSFEFSQLILLNQVGDSKFWLLHIEYFLYQILFGLLSERVCYGAFWKSTQTAGPGKCLLCNSGSNYSGSYKFLHRGISSS